jgi:hypothetical protein
VEHLAAQAGKLVTADALAKLVDWDRKTVQQFLTVRVPAKSKKYRLGYEVLSDKEGSYGLAVK